MSVPGWEPGTQYNYGDIVEFECKLFNLVDSHSLSSSFIGARYKIIQPHRSQVTPAVPCTISLVIIVSSYYFTQSDWTPPVTPALWGRIPDDKWDDHAPYNPPHDKGTAID